jgi:DNA-binding PadR family transcriptional regulator
VTAPWKALRGRLTARERAVLELLVGGGEMAGLELVEASSRLTRGTVYVALRRLADKGLVDSRPVNGAAFPALPLRLFRATGAGTAALARGAAPAPREAPA